MARRVDRRETDFISSLFDVPREIGNASLASFLELIVARCAEWFGASSVSLFLARGDTATMLLAATGGPSVTIPDEAVIKVGQGIAGTAVLDGEPVLIDDLADHPKFRRFVKRAKSSVASSMVVPLASNGGSIGVLNLSRGAGRDRFSEADLRLARSVASHLSLAIENARLVANLQEAVQATVAEQAKFRGIFEGLGLAAFLLDQQGRVVESNSKANDAVLRDFDFNSLLENLDQRLELDLTDPTSGRSWLAVLNPIPGGSTLILEETTDRERQRKEIDRLNRLAEIGQMTAAIAHEIRNPLTGIRSAAQMIRQAPEAADEFSRIIEEEAIKLNELCSQFLVFAKPVDASSQMTNIGEVAERVVRLIMPTYSERGIQLNLEIPEDLPMIEGDALHWEQVLLNLMLNALEASERGGQVSLGLSEGGLSVSDHGCGMTPDQVGRLFTPFFTTKPKGTGLGLSNVKKIVDAHGAQITVRSQREVGTRFDIRFATRRAA